MATVIGDRDVLLLGSSQRALNPLGANIILQQSAPLFKVDSQGNGLPSTITVTASLISLVGTVTFSATGATVTDNHDNTATVAFSSLTGNSCSITATLTSNGQTFTRSTTINKVADGAAGSAGQTGNQYATVQMYQWAAALPAKPNGTSGYTWATGVNSTYSGTDNWSVTVPTNPGTANLRLYVATVQITAAGGTASTIVSYTNASVQAYTQNGGTGPSGAQFIAVRVYQWAASIPAAPAGSSTYTWATGALSNIPSGWTDVPGVAPSQGMTLWAAQVTVTDSASATQTPVTWTSAAILVAGSSGSNGAAGPSGASYVTAYCASSTGTTSTAPAQTTGKTSLPATNDGGITGTWSATVPTLATGQYLYQSDGIYDPATNKVTWSIPYWSSLKVGNLSAITGNMGRLYVTDTISDTNGNWSLDAMGTMTAKKWQLLDNAGNIMIQAGGQLNPAYAAAGTLNSAISVNADGSLNGAGGGKVTLPGIGQDSYRIISLGSSATSAPAFGAGLYKNGTQLYGAGRSYMLAVIDRTTGAIAHFGAYDVYGVGQVGGSTAATLAGDLNYFADRAGYYIVIVWTFDEPQVNRTNSGMAEAMYRNGASRAVFGSPQFQYRSAYALVGISGCGEGNGAEAYQGSVASDPNAWIDVSFNVVAGNLTSVTLNYVPKTLQDYGYLGDMNATNGAPSGTSVGGTEAGLLASRALNGDSAYNALPGINSSLADKLSKGSGGILQGPVTLQTSGAISVGTATWVQGQSATGSGVVISPMGIAGMYNNTPKFYVSYDGNAMFAGTIGAGAVMTQSLSALNATIGTLRTASSGARIEISDNLIVGYRSNNTMSFKISA